MRTALIERFKLEDDLGTWASTWAYVTWKDGEMVYDYCSD